MSFFFMITDLFGEDRRCGVVVYGATVWRRLNFHGRGQVCLKILAFTGLGVHPQRILPCTRCCND